MMILSAQWDFLKLRQYLYTEIAEARARFNMKMCLTSIWNPIVKMICSWVHLISTMGFKIYTSKTSLNWNGPSLPSVQFCPSSVPLRHFYLVSAWYYSEPYYASYKKLSSGPQVVVNLLSFRNYNCHTKHVIKSMTPPLLVINSIVITHAGLMANLSANGSTAFKWKLCCHWLKGSRQCHITHLRHTSSSVQ